MFKKILSIILVINFVLPQAVVVYAQENTATPSARPPASESSPALSPSPFMENPLLPTLTPTIDTTPSPTITQAQTAAPSAILRRPFILKNPSRRLFQATESVEFVIESDPSVEYSAIVVDTNGKNAGISIEEINGESGRYLRLIPTNRLTPGQYTLNIRDWTNNVINESFWWGLLGINMNKSVYTPGEKADIDITVLNEQGVATCDAGVALSIRTPDDVSETILTKDCSAASYMFNRAGTYRLTLSNTTAGNVYTIEDSIEVRGQVPFTVERMDFSSRLDPSKSTDVAFTITANEDFTGQIVEMVPDIFDISSSSATPYTAADTGIGSQKVIRYPFDGTYPKTLDFGEQLVDSEQKSLYAQYGLLGHDGVDFATPEGTNVLAVDDGEVILAGHGAYGITVVLQHTWGRSYYGHLQGTGLNIGQKVLKGGSLGLSGSTGLSTGPHLHFGIKFTNNDMQNGYFGKVDPLPYLTGLSVYPGYGVRYIRWSASLSKGATKAFHYTLKAPDTRPRIYSVGPIRIISKENSSENPFVLGAATPGFSESRPWQIAVDAPAPAPQSEPEVLAQAQEALSSERSVISKRKKNNPMLKENGTGDKMYRWQADLQNQTVFSFGRKDKSDISPEVNIQTKDGWFLAFGDKDVKGKSVKPKVIDNIIEWSIQDGITARYSALEDRIKADYILADRQAIFQNRLDFTVAHQGNEAPGTMTPELIPDGDIVWMGEDWGEIFRMPKPVVVDAAGKAIWAAYELKKEQNGTATVSIVLQKEELDTAAYPVTVDPVTIDSDTAGNTAATGYGNGRKIMRDAFGNIFITISAGANNSFYYKSYNANTWTAATAFNITTPASSDIDANGDIHTSYVDANSDVRYVKFTVNRNTDNTISSISGGDTFLIDDSGKTARPSLIIANKGEGAGKEKVALIWAVNGTGGTKRGEIRFIQCDVADGCETASEWKNASEAANGNGTCSDTGTGDAGLPNSATCSGAADILFQGGSAGDKHHAVITQVPGRPARTPTGAYKDINGTPTTLTNALDDNTETAADVNSLTTTDYIYVGDAVKFSRIVMNITNTNANAQLFTSTRYCSANSDTATTCDVWSPMTNFLDNSATATVAMSEDGSILFDEPATWIASTENSTQGFWTRFRPAGAFDSTVSIAEIDVTDRHSKDLLVVGGANSNGQLYPAYIIWDFIGQAGWENIPGNTTVPAPWQQGADTVGHGYWSTTTNFPLSTTTDYINNAIFLSYVQCVGASCVTTFALSIKKIINNLSLISNANWGGAAFPAVTEALDINFSLTSNQNDIYLFYILDPETNALVYRKCDPTGGGTTDICDNSADWSAEQTLDSDTTLSHPQAVVSKAFGDTTAIDVIYTDTTDTDVRYERHLVNMADKTIVVAASGDDAYNLNCDSATDEQNITGTPANLGRQTTICTGSTAGENHAGFRFPNVTIPVGTSISSAYIDFHISYRSGSTPLDFTIYGEDTDDAAAFTTVANCSGDANCIQNRTVTATSSVQSIDFAANNSYRLDVTDMVQEIICRGAGSSQPCVGNYNGSGTWASGNDLAILLISTEGGGSNNTAGLSNFDSTGPQIDPTLQINLGNTSKRYSMGVLKAPVVSTDLDHPMSQEQFSGVGTDDAVFASVSASLVPSASSSANPVFQFKVNNTNNNNTDSLSATAIVKSSIPPKTYPSGGGHYAGKSIYLQLYHTTNGWETKDTETATAADTEITLDSGTVTGSTSYYQSESPGGTCSGSDCWAAWRIYQDAAPEANEILSVDIFSPTFTSSGPTLDQLLRHGAWFNASGVEQPFTF